MSEVTWSTSWMPSMAGMVRREPAARTMRSPVMVRDRLLILGGGFIAVEMGHVFDALGTQVTIVTRGDSLLTHEATCPATTSSSTWPTPRRAPSRTTSAIPEAPVATSLPVIPRAVFGSPQVASVGATEAELRAAGIAYLTARRDYGSTAYGRAMEDTTSFAKVLVGPGTRQLLGAHVMGPRASLVIQPLVQAMALGNTVDRVARDVIYIHPALSEVVENVLLEVPGGGTSAGITD